MAATQTVPHHSQHCNFFPILPRHGVITLFGYGIKVNVDRGHLTIQDGIGTDRREARLPRVSHGLRRLVVIGSDGMVSLAALRWLADQDAAFVMLDRAGSVLVTTGPVRPSDARLRRAQSLAQESGAALKIAIELIKQRDGNCRLTGEFAVGLSETSRIWRQALGPLAEWIAHTLWLTTSRPCRTKAPATRLTQRRKREAKGIPTTASIPPMVSRENPLEAPTLVRLNAHDPIAQARRADRVLQGPHGSSDGIGRNQGSSAVIAVVIAVVSGTWV
jgi:CRISPR associated protein, Cas1 family